MTGSHEVRGSIPLSSTINNNASTEAFFFAPRGRARSPLAPPYKPSVNLSALQLYK